MRSVSSPVRTRGLRTPRSTGLDAAALGGSAGAGLGVANNAYIVGGAILFLNSDPTQAASVTLSKPNIRVRFTWTPRFRGRWTRKSAATGRASGCAIDPGNPAPLAGSRAAVSRTPEDSAG